MPTKSGTRTGIFNAMQTPSPEWPTLKREGIEEKNFWEGVEGRMQDLIVYVCLRPLVRKEFERLQEESAGKRISPDGLKELGKAFFEEMTARIREKLIKFGKNEEELKKADAKTVAALFVIISKEAEIGKPGIKSEETRRVAGGNVTILRRGIR